MQKIGKYQISHLLGRGGMAEVWLGNHPTLNRQVAIKLLHRFLGKQAGFDRYFVQEARLVASLRHPNIIQLYDFDIDNGRPFMVMEYLEGGSLYDRLQLRGKSKLPIIEVIRLFDQITKGLSYAHQHGAIHRDLKPANILFTDEGEGVISDFGIAKLLHHEGNLNVTDHPIGTPTYMSPEQALGGKLDGRSDIYTLGVMLFELLTGVLPFQATTPAELLDLHKNTTPPKPSQLNPALPISIDQVILQALAKDPTTRFTHAEEMFEAMIHVLAGSVEPAASKRSTWGQMPNPAAISTGETAYQFKRGGQLLEAVHYFLLHIEEQLILKQVISKGEIDELIHLIEEHKDLRVNRPKVYWLKALITAKLDGWDSHDVTIALSNAEAEINPLTPSSFLSNLLMANWLHSSFNQQMQAAKQYAQKLIHIAQEKESPQIRAMGHLILGLTLLELKQFVMAKANFMRGLNLYLSKRSIDFILYTFLDTGLLLRMALVYTCRKMGEVQESNFYFQQLISFSQKIQSI